MPERPELRLSIISIWVGILIPIVAAVVPYLIGQFSPEHRLEYEVIGPISAKGVQALEIKITNNGSRVEKATKIWLKSFPLYELPSSLRPKGEKKKAPAELLDVESKASINVTQEGDYYVIAIGDLRPKETISVSVVAREAKLSIYRFSDNASGIEVKSDDRVAIFRGQSAFEEFFYPFGFWMFIILMILILALALWQEYFMSPKMREKMILKEIDKLKRDDVA